MEEFAAKEEFISWDDFASRVSEQVGVTYKADNLRVNYWGRRLEPVLGDQQLVADGSVSTRAVSFFVEFLQLNRQQKRAKLKEWEGLYCSDSEVIEPEIVESRSMVLASQSAADLSDDFALQKAAAGRQIRQTMRRCTPLGQMLGKAIASQIKAELVATARAELGDIGSLFDEIASNVVDGVPQ